MGGLCKAVELVREGSVINGATLLTDPLWYILDPHCPPLGRAWITHLHISIQFTQGVFLSFNLTFSLQYLDVIIFNFSMYEKKKFPLFIFKVPWQCSFELNWKSNNIIVCHYYQFSAIMIYTCSTLCVVANRLKILNVGMVGQWIDFLKTDINLMTCLCFKKSNSIKKNITL